MVHVIKAVCALRPATESDGMAWQECSLLPGSCGPLEAVKNASRFIGRSYAVCWASSKSLNRRSNSGIKLKRCDESAWFPGSFDLKAVMWSVAYWHFFYFVIIPLRLIYLFIYFLFVIQVNTTRAALRNNVWIKSKDTDEKRQSLSIQWFTPLFIAGFKPQPKLPDYSL